MATRKITGEGSNTSSKTPERKNQLTQRYESSDEDVPLRARSTSRKTSKTAVESLASDLFAHATNPARRGGRYPTTKTLAKAEDRTDESTFEEAATAARSPSKRLAGKKRARSETPVTQAEDNGWASLMSPPARRAAAQTPLAPGTHLGIGSDGDDGEGSDDRLEGHAEGETGRLDEDRTAKKQTQKGFAKRSQHGITATITNTGRLLKRKAASRSDSPKGKRQTIPSVTAWKNKVIALHDSDDGVNVIATYKMQKPSVVQTTLGTGASIDVVSNSKRERSADDDRADEAQDDDDLATRKVQTGKAGVLVRKRGVARLVKKGGRVNRQSSPVGLPWPSIRPKPKKRKTSGSVTHIEKSVDSTDSADDNTVVAQRKHPATHKKARIRKAVEADGTDVVEIDDSATDVIAVAPRKMKKPSGSTTQRKKAVELDDSEEDVVAVAPHKKLAARRTASAQGNTATDAPTQVSEEDADAPITVSKEIARPSRKAKEVAFSAMAASVDVRPRKRTATVLDKDSRVDAEELEEGVVDVSGLIGNPLDQIGFVAQEIARMKHLISNHKNLYVASAPTTLQEQNIPRLQTKLIEVYCPKNGRIWRGGLNHWLRSGAALPIIKLWYDACMADKATLGFLKQLLPLKDYPWRAQLGQVTDLARQRDSGRAQANDAIILLCAIYTRKLFLCNTQRLLKDGIDTGDYIWERMLDVPCAVLFAVYHDIVTAPTGRETFFSVLLKSPLALPMSAATRTSIEKKFSLPNPYPHPLDEISFFTAAEGFKPSSDLPPPAPANAIDYHSSYEADPFSDREQLLFWLAFKDKTKLSRSFGIDVKHIAELLPGRTDDEISTFYKLNEVNLGLTSERRVIIARTGEPGQEHEDDVDSDQAPSEAEDEPQLPPPVQLKILDTRAAFEKLQTYIPPPPLPVHPPQLRKNIHPSILVQMHALDAAMLERQEAEMELAQLEVDLEDAKREAEDEEKWCCLKVQMAWFERDEWKDWLVEKRSVFAREARRLREVEREFGGDAIDKEVEGKRKEVADLNAEKGGAGEVAENGVGSEGADDGAEKVSER